MKKVLLIFLLLLAACTQPPNQVVPGGTQVREVESCGDNTNLFSVSPINDEDFIGLVPLGLLSPPGHTFPTRHMYFFIKLLGAEPEQGTHKVAVYAPGDMIITSIKSMENKNDNILDYSIEFFTCKEFKGYFHHMSSLSPELLESFKDPNCHEYETGGRLYRHCQKNVKIKVSAGEEIGTAGGVNQQAHLDFGAIDYRSKPLDFANPDRWEKDALHIVCPVDYFTIDLKSRISDFGGTLKTKEPICGQTNQDVKGTAQGIWFKKDVDFTREDEHVALVRDWINPEKPVFSIGAVNGVPPDIYYFQPKSEGYVNIDFTNINQRSIICYNVKDEWDKDLDFVLLLQLVNDNHLRLEKLEQDHCGLGPWEFTVRMSEFER